MWLRSRCSGWTGFCRLAVVHYPCTGLASSCCSYSAISIWEPAAERSSTHFKMCFTGCTNTRMGVTDAGPRPPRASRGRRRRARLNGGGICRSVEKGNRDAGLQMSSPAPSTSHGHGSNHDETGQGVVLDTRAWRGGVMGPSARRLMAAGEAWRPKSSRSAGRDELDDSPLICAGVEGEACTVCGGDMGSMIRIDYEIVRRHGGGRPTARPAAPNLQKYGSHLQHAMGEVTDLAGTTGAKAGFEVTRGRAPNGWAASGSISRRNPLTLRKDYGGLPFVNHLICD